MVATLTEGGAEANEEGLPEKDESQQAGTSQQTQDGSSSKDESDDGDSGDD
jgi:hypothetical protein